MVNITTLSGAAAGVARMPGTRLFCMMVLLTAATIPLVAQSSMTPDQLVGEWSVQPSFVIEMEESSLEIGADDPEFYGTMVMRFRSDGSGTVSADEEARDFEWRLSTEGDASVLSLAYPGYESESLLMPVGEESVIMLENQSDSAYVAILRRGAE